MFHTLQGNPICKTVYLSLSYVKTICTAHDFVCMSWSLVWNLSRLFVVLYLLFILHNQHIDVFKFVPDIKCKYKVLKNYNKYLHFLNLFIRSQPFYIRFKIIMSLRIDGIFISKYYIFITLPPDSYSFFFPRQRCSFIRLARILASA